MRDIIPIFKTQGSIGKSILRASDVARIAKENKMAKVGIVNEAVSDFAEILKEMKKVEVGFWFGYLFNVCNDLSSSDEEIKKSECKMIAFVKNDAGYKTLCEFYTEVECHDKRAIDYKTILKKYKDRDLLFAVPFYDSFLFKNTLFLSDCSPNFGDLEICMLLDDNDLPFEKMVRTKVLKYAKSKGYETQEVKNIFYEKGEDFTAYLTQRIKKNDSMACGARSSNIGRPNLDHMFSRTFSFESFLKDVKEDNRGDIKPYKTHHWDRENKNFTQKYLIFDTETEGLNLENTKAWQIAWVEMEGRKVINEEEHYLRWNDLNISEEAKKITGFNQRVYDEAAEDPLKILNRFWKLLSNPEYLIVGQNILGFDVYVLNSMRKHLGLEVDFSFINRCIDTVSLSRSLVMDIKKLKSEESLEWCYKMLHARRRGKGVSVSQGTMLKRCNIPVDESMLHSALYDTQKCGELFLHLTNLINI